MDKNSGGVPKLGLFDYIMNSKTRRFNHNKLNTTDIAGTVPDLHKSKRYINGRDCFDLSDIPGATNNI